MTCIASHTREYAEHLERDRALDEAEHHGSTDARDVQMRGEHLYIADGRGGFRVFDVAQIYQKGFSEKIVSAPVSPIGQDTNVRTRDATAVAAPSTLAVDPTRIRLQENQEQPVHPVYGYIYITDRQEGLVLSTAAILLDGNPLNNFLERAATFNPDGILDGAVNIELAGHYAYILCDRGLVIVDLDDPLNPRVAGQVTDLRDPRAMAIQFRYAFVTDADGLQVIDVTEPERPRKVDGAGVDIDDAHGLYVARTYAYVAAGADGLVIVDVERPEAPRIDQTFTADGAINDARDVKVAMTNASVFAYIADGVNGLRVVQLVSANGTPGAFGFSPRPTPTLIASHPTGGGGRRSPSRRGSTATTQSTRRATRWPSSDAAAPGPSPSMRCGDYSYATGRCGPCPTRRRARRVTHSRKRVDDDRRKCTGEARPLHDRAGQTESG